MKLSLPVKFALFSFVITLFGVIGVALMAYVESDKLLQQEAVHNLFSSMGNELISIEKQSTLVKDDVQFLARSEAIRVFANRFEHPDAYSAMAMKHIEHFFSTVLSRREMYYQVRLIGVEDGGREVVRVARLAQGLTVINDDLLQQKGKRDYYQRSIQLKAGEILYSDISFNREHGEITLPVQAMLRVSTAIYSDSGQLRGILLINADFNVFTASMQHKHNDQRFFISNARGDYLIHWNRNKAMAFEYHRQARLQDDYLLNDQTLSSSFQVEETKIDEYIFDQQDAVLLLGKIHLDQQHKSHALTVGAVVELKQLRLQSIALRNRMLLLTLMLAIALGFITYLVARYFIRPIQSMIDAAVKIGNGHENVQIPANSHDEIGILGAALQQMLLHLHETRRKTEALNVALEVKVSKRTAELARLAGTLEAQNSELERAVRNAEHAATAKDRFLATMSHEIRTPLNGVLGLTELLLATDLSFSQRENLKTVRSCGESLLVILNDILDFSKMEAGLMEIQLGECNPNLIIEHVAKLFSGRVNEEERKLELIVRGMPHLPHLLMGDAGRLQQVMMNLLSNAVKFTSAGDITIAADLVSESPTAVRVRFQVRDTGNGISIADQAHLFEEFTQADGTDTRKHGGTGLGLAIVKRLVALMGSNIGLESNIGQGSCFFFELEMQKGAEVGDKAQDYHDDFSCWRVLVIDDNATNRAMLNDALTAWGMQCRALADAVSALHDLQTMAATDKAYDVVLIDQQMDDMGGMALARLIKADPHLADLKVIMTTSLDMTFNQTLCDEYGLHGFIRKPVYVHSLFETVLSVMGVRQRRFSHGQSVHGQRARQQGVAQQNDQRHQRSERILLAEDNVVNQQVAVGMLKNQGFEWVDVANHGGEALELMSQNHYDLILMDIQMPELDGIATTREIRQMEQFHDDQPIPIIALTAHALDEDKQGVRDAGMNDHLSKPLTGKALALMMEQWLPRDEAKTSASLIARDADIQEQAVIEVELEISVIDAGFLRQLRQDMGFGLAMILDTYCAELPKQVEGLIAAIERGNADELRRYGHRLKGSSRSVAANSLGELCYQLELLGQSGQANDMAAAKLLVADLSDLATQVLAAFSEDWLNEIR